jgi:hypothetical protein
MPDIIKISEARFEALVGLTREHFLGIPYLEIEWFSDLDEHVLGAIIFDVTDQDFSYVILGRDEHKQYRGIDFAVSIDYYAMAKTKLLETLQQYSLTGKSTFPQNDDSSMKGVDLFSPVYKQEKLNENFVRLCQDEGLSSAKGILAEIMHYFYDVDGNFVEQFQTTGFDARLWEIYLFTYLKEEEFSISKDHETPDFFVSKYGKSVCIEAVTVNPTVENKKKIDNEQWFEFRSPEETRKLLDNYMPIKFGSPLYSKLKKRYWEQPHISGHPLVFAIADFHEDASMTWSTSALWEYLYGIRQSYRFNENNKLIIDTTKVESHQLEKKIIPSGYFFQPEAEYVSAVLFSASGTISKFNRLGKIAGFGSDRVKIYQTGSCYNHNENAASPKLFSREITKGRPNETWAEGVNMFHNPQAKYPVPEELFPSIAHHKLIDGQISSRIPAFHPFGTVSMTFSPEPS